jgi:hypothetical protein
MREIRTPSGKPFRFKKCDGGEIIVYASDKKRKHQDKDAIIITPYTVKQVCDAIKNKVRIRMGASRDLPPESSLGAILRKDKQSPQQLSYLTAILESEGFCRIEKEGKAFVIVFIK